MPVQPLFDWEQTEEDVFVTAQIKGFKKDAIDVFISDLFVKVNAAPTYLLQLDLVEQIVVEQSHFRFDLPNVKLTLKKKTRGLVWDTLCIDKKTAPSEVQKRRKEAQERAEALYNVKLDTREQQKEIEKKRMFNEQWELEKGQRSDIEKKVKAEREGEQSSLYQWEEQVKAATKAIRTPGDILAAAAQQPVRGEGETLNVAIDFTPKQAAVPTRSRGDEDYYRKCRYKPVSIEDSPMFWKEKADKLYRARDFQGAADAYSESIKRDGAFLTCVSNRAACWIHLHQYKRAVEDCDLALTMLSNTPASETTQERYRQLLTKLHVRRGAAYCWDGQMSRGVDDYRMAVAYRNSEGGDNDILRDMETLEEYMRKHALTAQRDPLDDRRATAQHTYYKGKYAQAAAEFREILQIDEFDVRTRSNLCATLLQQGLFTEALEEAQKVIQFCAEVASALSEPGAQSASLVDSDDEEDGDDEFVTRKLAAARKIREKSGHVYLLLKAYVRAGACYCGLKDYRKGYEMYELALRVTPYDDDLREDANRILEKIRFTTLVESTKGGSALPPDPVK